LHPEHRHFGSVTARTHDDPNARHQRAASTRPEPTLDTKRLRYRARCIRCVPAHVASDEDV
jgi:hypothetical protein